MSNTPHVPTLAVAPNPAEVGETVAFSGGGYPGKTAVFVVITDNPSLLVDTSRTGAFVIGRSFAEAGTFNVSVCYFKKQQGGRWDCHTVEPVILVVG